MLNDNLLWFLESSTDLVKDSYIRDVFLKILGSNLSNTFSQDGCTMIKHFSVTLISIKISNVVSCMEAERSLYLGYFFSSYRPKHMCTVEMSLSPCPN